MAGVAVNMTLVPVQIVLPGAAAMLTDGTTFVFTVTARVCAGLLPQELTAITDIFPLPAPTVTVMEFVVELPVHPPPGGSVQK